MFDNLTAFGQDNILQTLLETISKRLYLKGSWQNNIVQRLIETPAKPQLLKAAQQRHTRQRLVKICTKLNQHNAVPVTNVPRAHPKITQH